MTADKNVLFLCTGNSCRSQMAEAIANHRLGDVWRAYSTGTKPAGFVHPGAIQVLKEIGIDHQGRSKSVHDFREFKFEIVITVCDSAERECPVWLGPGRRVHQSYPDPAAAQGSEDEVLAVFRKVRDDMLREIPRLLRRYRSRGEI